MQLILKQFLNLWIRSKFFFKTCLAITCVIDSLRIFPEILVKIYFENFKLSQKDFVKSVDIY